MAEFVQFRMEESLPHLEELESVGIFSRKEIKRIIKRRTAFEYRMQRYVKSKEDYLSYIQYEINLLKLMHLRQKRLGIGVDYTKVDFELVTRINAIFTRAVSRFQSDVKLWLSFIQFCCQVNWKGTASRLYAKMLRVLASKPEVWVAAAKFEMEDNEEPEVARKLLLRGLRFHPKSKKLFLEYFKMELLNCQMKREELEIVFDEDVSKNYADDPVVSGKIAVAVYRNATEIINDASFVISFVNVCEAFDFTHSIQEIIYTDLAKKFSKNAESRTALAKRPFAQLMCSKQWTGNITKKIEFECLHNMEEAVDELATEQMWLLYLEFCKELVEYECYGKRRTGLNQERRKNHLIDVMCRASKLRFLPRDYYNLWASYAKRDDLSAILELATEQFPGDADIWVRKITHRLQQRNDESTKPILALFEKAFRSVPSHDSYKIWNVSVSWHMASCPKDLPELFERGLAAHESVSSRMKIQYLDWVLLKDGLKAGRKLFRRLWSMHPITMEFFTKACEMELVQPKPSMKHLSEIMDCACSNFGNSNVDLWIRYMELVKRFSDDVGHAGVVHWRAVKALDPNLVDKFVTHCVLLRITDK